MIYYVDPQRYYTDRSYLTQWFFKPTLVVNDNDFENIEITNALVQRHLVQNRIIDITHNPYKEQWLPMHADIILTNNFEFWYKPQPNYVFFPLFLWMYSLRTSLWWPGFSFDAGSDKTQQIMCLNKNPRPHRTWLWDRFNRSGVIAKMDYSFEQPDSNPEQYPWPRPLKVDNDAISSSLHGNDVSVNNMVYYKCAVNLVTETGTDFTYVSEKTCKPFIARQIPVIVGSYDINRFLSDTGLDMFEDIVPWRTWDSDLDEQSRLTKIADFVESWINSGTILDDYRRVLPRIEQNKRYFHSEQFRDRIMNQMSNLKP